MVMWMLIELIRDTDLLREIREEVSQVYNSKEGSMDVQKLISLPLLQSVFSEVLRLHMSFNVMRNVEKPVNVEKYEVRPGAMIQISMTAAHLDPEVWTVEDHPVDQFWAERHIKYVEETDEQGNVNRKRAFDMGGRAASFFPFGE